MASVGKAPKFLKKNGELTQYALSCGYVQSKGNFKLHREHNCYHIVGKNKDGKLVWVSTSNLTLARKALRLLASGKPIEKHSEIGVAIMDDNKNG